MHWRGHSHDMNSRAIYGDVVAEVRDELRRRVDAVVAEGVDPSMIILDPGLGFSKLSEHNWQVLAALPEIAALVPVDGPVAGGGPPAFPGPGGASRKRVL